MIIKVDKNIRVSRRELTSLITRTIKQRYDMILKGFSEAVLAYLRYHKEYNQLEVLIEKDSLGYYEVFLYIDGVLQISYYRDTRISVDSVGYYHRTNTYCSRNYLS